MASGDRCSLMGIFKDAMPRHCTAAVILTSRYNPKPCRGVGFGLRRVISYEFLKRRMGQSELAPEDTVITCKSQFSTGRPPAPNKFNGFSRC